ncbi:hypothetical protein phytr_2570 [Candidatus Phycorickettsia trachydisci]|uniref:Uncharacterized protein n=1 Tax=Candidatus Phycorickettsia trachydisci TaxID=2115978 RepID=A0A2P1P7H3_9RICK|nr:ankyrin repeat domain-containing protein [Candidatus Phycorickettsia trachydisci]AVP87214.1 hypothetical protein phytr_2570 [Candidatus Phycorickettsia trachydisci]
MELWQEFKDWWYKYTYFNNAIKKGDLEEFKKLIDHYKLSDYLTANRRGIYFCQKALEAKQTHIVHYVMDLSNTNKELSIDDLDQILTHAAYYNNLDIAQRVCNYPNFLADEAFFKWIIYEAIKHKSSDVALLLIDKSIKILKAKRIKYLFRKAAYYNNLEIIEDLLKREALDLERQKYFVIWLICEAIKKGNSNMATLLLNSAVEISPQSQRDILSYAVMQNDLMVAENILNRRNEILFRDERWILGSLVEYAIIKHHPEMALLMLSSGALINPSPNSRSLMGLAYNQSLFNVMAKVIDKDVLIHDKSVWKNYIGPNREKIREAIENDYTLNPQQKLESLFKIRKGLMEWHVVESNLFVGPILRQALKIVDCDKRLQTLIELKRMEFTSEQRGLYENGLIQAAHEGNNSADKWHKLFSLIQNSILSDATGIKRSLYELTKNHKWKKRELLRFLDKLSDIDIDDDAQMQSIESFIQSALNPLERIATSNK